MNQNPITHDYTSRRWGHAVDVLRIIGGGQRLRVSGYGHGVNRGDFLLLPNEGASTRYSVLKIEYMRDPKDMWFADLEFAPRQGNAAQ